jgi:hypothetical protein
VTLAVTEKTISGRVSRRQRVSVFQKHRLSVDRKSMGHTVAEQSLNEADFLCISCVWRGVHGIVL